MAVPSPDSVSSEDPRPLALGIATFSLDLARGALAFMGLHDPDEGALRRVLREIITESALAPPGAAAAAQRVSSTLGRLRAEFGEKTAVTFLDILRDLFAAPVDHQWYLWRSLILYGTDLATSPPPELVLRIREKWKMLRPIQLPLDPQTPWDRSIFEEYGFPAARESHEITINPISVIQDAMDERAFRHAIREALGRGSHPDIDLDKMWTWANAKAPAIGVPRHLLRHPRELFAWQAKTDISGT